MIRSAVGVDRPGRWRLPHGREGNAFTRDCQGSIESTWLRTARLIP